MPHNKLCEKINQNLVPLMAYIEPKFFDTLQKSLKTLLSMMLHQVKKTVYLYLGNVESIRAMVNILGKRFITYLKNEYAVADDAKFNGAINKCLADVDIYSADTKRTFGVC